MLIMVEGDGLRHLMGYVRLRYKSVENEVVKWVVDGDFFYHGGHGGMAPEGAQRLIGEIPDALVIG